MMLKKKVVNIRTVLLAIQIFLLALPSFAHAHSMVAQHGTLNFVGKYVYLVLSLPASAFNTGKTNVDENNDGYVSMIEFNRNRKNIADSVQQNVFFSAKQDKLNISGLMLNPVTPHHHTNNENIEQIIVMGRYTLPNEGAVVEFNLALFGKSKQEQLFSITGKDKERQLKQTVEMSPLMTSQRIFN